MTKQHGNRRNRRAWAFLKAWAFSNQKDKPAVETKMVQFVSQQIRERFVEKEI